MKAISRMLIFCLLIVSSINIGKSQCIIDAGKNQTLVCGGSTKLTAVEGLTRTYSDTIHYFNSIFFTSSDTGYVVGTRSTPDYWDNRSIFLKTTNGGDSWIIQTDTAFGSLNSIYFIDAKTGYAAGGMGFIYKTSDGGTHWNQVAFGGYFDNYYSIIFTTKDTGFIAGNNGKILKTTNGGTNWNLIHSDTTMMISSISFPDNQTGYAAGSAYGIASYLLKTTNSGKDWTAINDTLHYGLQSVYFLNADTGYITGKEQFPFFYGTASDILKTTDGGKTWKVVYKVSGIILYSVRFMDETIGYASGSKGTLLKTTDGGNSWQTITTKTNNSLTSIGFSNQNKVIALGWQTGIYTGSIPMSYSWSPLSSMNDSTLADPTVSPIMNTTYKVTATFKSGCMVTDSVKVMVNPLLVYANDVVASCGNNAYLSANTNYTGNGSLNYAWSPKENLSDSTLSNPVASVIKPSSFAVEVTTPNGCSASKNINVNTNVIDIQPSICMVTVGDKFKNAIVWSRPVSNAIDSFFIYRESTNQTGVYDLIGKSPYLAQSVFIDSSSNALVQSNRYKIAIKDVCEHTTSESTAHKTMHLNINQAQGSSWNLIWEEYEGFAVGSYKIYRGSTLADMQLIGSTAGGNSSYSDFAAPGGDIFYQVEITPPSDCSNIKSNTYSSSRSNIASNTVLSVSGVNANGISFKAYPVPAKEELFFNLPVSNKAKVSISSIDGKFIMNCNLNNSQNSISISSLHQGMFILRIMDNQNTYVTKFIKE
jgi:photosystem II stability/assembly factor-like uncharacterized protein